MVLVCDFAGFKVPEMTKKRPVVVISPWRGHSRRGYLHGLCTVVPLSTKIPYPVEPYHHRIDLSPFPWNLAQKETWAKCDTVATVSINRMNRPYHKKRSGVRPGYMAVSVTSHDLEAIQMGVMAALGLSNLTGA
ncbi:MAG: type II toxin-antitoxin system PemK/MazF family toxin [Pseudohongiellaceae bacterium]